ncbi:MAG: hypothetical protein SFW67_07480 [Myxococcaceae bacterium]|nr:hypothetical protein [Myxococcaceae bacterium]
MEQQRWRAVAVVWVVGLVGCGAPKPVADAGSEDASTAVESDAGSTDAGAAGGGAPDAGGPEVEPDGGPREPTGAATQVLFQDDFERWANTAAIKGSYGDQREQNASFSLDGTVAAGGSRSLRIDYPQNAACQDADVFIGKVLANTSPLTAVLTYRFRFSRDFRFQQPATWCQGRGLSSTEAVVGREGMARGALVLAAAAEPDGGVGLRWQVTVRDVRAQVTPAQPNSVYRQHLRVTRLGPAAVADDAWHRLTMLVQRETSLGAGNGVLRVWIDGDAVLDFDGEGNGPARGQVFTGTAPFGSIAFPTTLVTGASQAQSRWFDEVVLFEP